MNCSLRLGNSSIRLITSFADSLARFGLSILISLMSFTLFAIPTPEPKVSIVGFSCVSGIVTEAGPQQWA
jgi:hypothetical protein